MKGERKPRDLTPDELRWILEVTRRLAAPLDLDTMLREVVDVARGVLDADFGMVWLHDAPHGELTMQLATGLEAMRVPVEHGILGESLKRRAVINIADCWEDPRFDREFDVASGYRTRCMLTLPMVGSDDTIVGALQIVNRREGVFDADDEVIAHLLADQCAVALQRVRMTEQLLAAGRLQREIAVAHEIQMATVPQSQAQVAGYDVAGLFRPADETGGDTYDFIALPRERYAILMGDATGHGIGPALLATHVRAMLRVALRLEADMDETFRHMNNQLVEDLPPDRFVTAFLGLLDTRQHQVRYHAAGQGPILHYSAATGACDLHPPTTFPLGAMSMPAPRQASVLDLAPGDILLLASDGIYEYQDAGHREFGVHAIAALVQANHRRPMAALVAIVMRALSEFGGGAAQADDLSMVLIHRLPGSKPVARPATGPEPRGMEQRFPRSLDSLAAVFEFVGRFLAAEGLDPGLRFAIELTVEELFANMVKHNADGKGDIRLALAREPGAIVGTIEDFDSPRFDVAAPRPVDVRRPLAQRRPGGLGLHLIHQLVDSIDYRWADRVSTTTFRKLLGKT
jgi:phosphoserine phosphatase